MVAPRLIDTRFDGLSPQQGTELYRRVLLHRRQSVSVDVVRDVGLCVAEPLRNDNHRITTSAWSMEECRRVVTGSAWRDHFVTI